MSKKDEYELIKDELKIWAKARGIKLSIRRKEYNVYEYSIMSYKEPLMNSGDYATINNNIKAKDHGYLTERGKELIQEMFDIILKYYYYEKDVYTDCFYYSFYYSVSIGKWDKPFQIK